MFSLKIADIKNENKALFIVMQERKKRILGVGERRREQITEGRCREKRDTSYEKVSV